MAPILFTKYCHLSSAKRLFTIIEKLMFFIIERPISKKETKTKKTNAKRNANFTNAQHLYLRNVNFNLEQ